MSKPRADQLKHHIIYKTTCVITGRWYIGMHSTDDLTDGYIGSGQRLWHSIKKHGKDQHRCEILEYLPDRKSLTAREAELVHKDLLKDPMCMNLRTGGTGFVPGAEITQLVRDKMSAACTERWVRDREKLKQKLDEELDAFTMTREEVIAVLVQSDGKLSKNATRALLKLKADRLAGQDGRKILAKRERRVQAKWAFVLEQIENDVFGPDVVQQIDAYIYERDTRPTCKVCSKQTTFFRFGEPYGTYCGARCQLLDPSFKNPVLSRYALNKQTLSRTIHDTH